VVKSLEGIVLWLDRKILSKNILQFKISLEKGNFLNEI